MELGEAVMFERPDGPALELAVRPRLASWMKAGHPDQVRLATFLDHVESLVSPALTTLPGPLALRLDVGLDPAIDLLHQYDLDNYLLPVVKRLGSSRFSSVWATKTVAERSFIRVEQAKPAGLGNAAECSCEVLTRSAATEKAFKQEVCGQVRHAGPLPDGPAWLQLRFTVSPRRNWANLWKPVIDALDPIFGRTNPNKEWNPQDGRIVELGLHRDVDADVGNAVKISLRAGSIR